MQIITREYQAFEQQIERIHRLLDGIDAKITWDDRIPDPDNPNQSRQIDISIKRENTLTLVECRARQKPQDVMWIEELYGRCVSLKADLIIGVSNSGFTEGAEKKAERLGVILREFKTLSPQEVTQWGKTTSLELIFIKFRKVIMICKMPANYSPNDQAVFINKLYEKTSANELLRTLINENKNIFQTEKYVSFRAKINFQNIMVNGTQPLAINLQGEMKTHRVKANKPIVSVYQTPGSDDGSWQAKVEQFNNEQSQIIKQDGPSHMFFDFRSIEVPKNHIFVMPLFYTPDGLAISQFSFVGLDHYFKDTVEIECKFQIAI